MIELVAYAIMLMLIAAAIGSAVALVTPLARRLRGSHRMTARGVVAGGAVTGVGAALAGMYFLASGLTEQPNAMYVINDSGSAMVLEETFGFLPDAEIDVTFFRDDPVRISSVDRGGARCISQRPQRLLLVDEGVELQSYSSEATGHRRVVPLDPTDFEVALELSAETCFPGRRVWLSWNGTELRQVGEPGLRGHSWIMIVAGVVAAACVAVGFLADRRAQGPEGVPGPPADPPSLDPAFWPTPPPTAPPHDS